MPRRDAFGDWRRVERTPEFERWEHPTLPPIELRHVPSAPSGGRWSWRAGKAEGQARTNKSAFGLALAAVGQ